MNQVVTQQATSRDRIDVLDAVPLLDTGRFEHMQRVATVMARSTLMPESLYMTGKKDEKEMLPYEQILSNCFLVVNQAVRWGLDPFAVAQCVSVVHGKLCYEGKLVAAVLQAKMGMSLHHHFDGEGDAMRIYLSDKPLTEKIIPELRPGYRRQDMRLLDGSVAEWKTTGTGTPWTAKNLNRMLVYRGTRDWCRIYEPALMLGVYTDDEMVDMTEASRFRRANDITPVQTVADPFGDEPQSAKIEEAEIVAEEPETPASEPDAGEQGVSEPSFTDADADAWVLNSVNMLIASVMIGGDLDVARDQYRSIKQNAPAWVDKPTIIRVDAVSVFLSKVMLGDEEFDKERIANIANIDVAQVNDLPRSE